MDNYFWTFLVSFSLYSFCFIFFLLLICICQLQAWHCLTLGMLKIGSFLSGIWISWFWEVMSEKLFYFILFDRLGNILEILRSCCNPILPFWIIKMKKYLFLIQFCLFELISEVSSYSRKLISVAQPSEFVMHRIQKDLLKAYGVVILIMFNTLISW